MLDFNEETRRLVSTFLAYRNDIDIYTEDENKDKEFYKFLFKKILPANIKINDVTPLGCRNNVIRRCIEEPSNGRKKLFIVDSDINLIHGLNIPSHRNLFVLNAYCIENLLFDEETVIKYIYNSCAIKPIEDIKVELNFEEWLNGYTEPLINLFLHFAVIDMFDKPYTLYNANRFHEIVQKGILQFNRELVYKEIERLKSEILTTHSEEDYHHNLNELKTMWECNVRNLITVISGKDYLIPMLLIKTQTFKKSKATPSLEEIKMSLVNIGDLKRFNNLRARIEAIFAAA
jgi:hypothetical protein